MKELEQYLEGLDATFPEAFYRLAEVIKCQVLELCGDCIPYMMNDALEYYLQMKGLRIAGTYHPGITIESARIVSKEEKYSLILRQEDGNVVTLHFKDLTVHGQCYRYHEIGHFWVKGEEQWRQLVYIIGTIRDKYEYFGERFCNQEEQELMNLIHFAPFHAWSPIHESLDEWYPKDERGIFAMERLAKDVSDRSYLRLIRWYRRLPFHWMTGLLSKRLLHPKRQALYELIWKKVERASAVYPCRDYGEVMNQWIKNQRNMIHQKMKEQGFSGDYPEYTRENMRVIATEQQPFTLMEREDYAFRIQFMVSECDEKMVQGRNAGFFYGTGRKGWISDGTDFN